ncbi:MAG: thioredoxin family protein [Cyanobacteria bacterium SZAS LIN-3]|nr:thioredoxin family protein [Cyanobacteria bacterium SZAS LIN-3]
MAIMSTLKRPGARAAKSLLLMATAIVVLPQAALADLNGAVAKYNAKDYQGALNEFKALYARDPKNSLCRYYMAMCNQCLARVEEAKKDYQWVIDHGAANLKGNAQAGLAQLEKVGGRTGGSSTMTTTTTPAATSTAKADSGKPSTDLIDRGPAGKDGKTTTTPPATTTATKPAEAGSNVARVINFYSEASRGSQLMEPAWDEVKAKFPKITFVKVNTGDPLCEKYNISEFPSVVMLDKNGKALATQAGPQSTESMETTINTCNQKK